MFQAFITDNATFKSWSTEHYLWIVYALVSLGLFIKWGRKSSPEKQTKIGTIISLIGVLIWCIAEMVMLTTGNTPLSATLPFHLCFFLNLILPYMMYRRSFFLFELVYPWVMAGCLQALITPDLDTSFPGYFSVRYWFVHIGLVQSVLYAVFVYEWRPSIWCIPKALLAGNLYMGVLFFVNGWLGTNFMYLNQKPPGTILDYLGDHYLLWGELLAATLFLVVWLPFAFKRKAAIQAA